MHRGTSVLDEDVKRLRNATHRARSLRDAAKRVESARDLSELQDALRSVKYWTDEIERAANPSVSVPNRHCGGGGIVA